MVEIGGLEPHVRPITCRTESRDFELGKFEIFVFLSGGLGGVLMDGLEALI